MSTTIEILETLCPMRQAIVSTLGKDEPAKHQASAELQALRAGIDAVKSTAWIAVTEELPPLGEIVWLCEEGRGPWIGSRADEPDGWLWSNSYGSFWWNGKKWDGDQEADDDYQPTHWMRLPEPPNPKLSGGMPAAGSPST